MSDQRAAKLVERLAACVTDENGQPLVCYGCAHSAAFMRYTDGKIVDETSFPGRPSGERPCCFCIRNPQRETQRSDAEARMNLSLPIEWYDGSPAIKYPMDCYHSCDMKSQFQSWSAADEQKIKELEAGMKGGRSG